MILLPRTRGGIFALSKDVVPEFLVRCGNTHFVISIRKRGFWRADCAAPDDVSAHAISLLKQSFAIKEPR